MNINFVVNGEGYNAEVPIHIVRAVVAEKLRNYCKTLPTKDRDQIIQYLGDNLWIRAK